MGVVLPEIGDPVWVSLGGGPMQVAVVIKQEVDNGDRFTVVERSSGERHRVRANGVNQATWQPVKVGDIRPGDLLHRADKWPMWVNGVSDGALVGTLTLSGLPGGGDKENRRLLHHTRRHTVEAFIVRPLP